MPQLMKPVSEDTDSMIGGVTESDLTAMLETATTFLVEHGDPACTPQVELDLTTLASSAPRSAAGEVSPIRDCYNWPNGSHFMIMPRRTVPVTA